MSRLSTDTRVGTVFMNVTTKKIINSNKSYATNSFSRDHGQIRNIEKCRQHCYYNTATSKE